MFNIVCTFSVAKIYIVKILQHSFTQFVEKRKLCMEDGLVYLFCVVFIHVNVGKQKRNL